jgi:hypothetical protein
VNNVVNVTNVYNRTVIVNNDARNVSYNGGSGGIVAQPTREQEEAARDRHIQATSVQTQHVREASTNRQLFESSNHGRPPIAATPRPSEFGGRGVVQARDAGPSYRPPTARSVTPGGGNVPRQGNQGNQSFTHARDVPPPQSRFATSPAGGNAGGNQRYQQDQQKLWAKQEQERQNLQRKQDQEHQRMDQRGANDAQRQRVEQQHQQQTQQMVQRHAQQQQQFEQKQRSRR